MYSKRSTNPRAPWRVPLLPALRRRLSLERSPLERSPLERSTLERRLPALGLWLLAACFVLPPVAADDEGQTCMRAEFAGLTDPLLSRPFALHEVVAHGVDLSIEIEGRPTAGILRLVDPAGTVLADHDFDLVDGRQTLWLQNALAELPERGLQFRVEMVDSVTGSTVFDAPLRFGLDCASGDDCQWQPQLHVFSDGPLIDRPLADVLAELAAHGVDDPYAVVESDYPELATSLLELLMQTSVPGASGDEGGGDTLTSEPGGSGRPIACRCDWIGVYAYDPPRATGSFSGPPPLHEHSIWAGGLGFWSGQMIEGQYSTQIPAQGTYAGVQLVCARQLGERVRYFALPGGRKLAIPEPIQSTCPAPCTGTVDHYANTHLCASAKGFARSQTSIEANVELTGEAWVDGSLLFSQPVQALLQTTSPSGERRRSDAAPSGTATVQANLSGISLRHYGSAKMAIFGTGQPVVPYVYADASVWPTLSVIGEATCTDTSRREVSIGGGSSGGGSVIERWGDPP